jgi:trimeric autotransporter adhesin
MSTKTTFKRIALATVAAMGFGLLSVVPANAAVGAVVWGVSNSAVNTTVGVSTGITVNLTTVNAAADDGDAFTITPTKVASEITLAAATPGSLNTATANGWRVAAGGTSNASLLVTETGTGAGATKAAADGTTIGVINFTASAPGLYSITLTASSAQGATFAAPTVSVSINVTAGPNAGLNSFITTATTVDTPGNKADGTATSAYAISNTSADLATNAPGVAKTTNGGGRGTTSVASLTVPLSSAIVFTVEPTNDVAYSANTQARLTLNGATWATVAVTAADPGVLSSITAPATAGTYTAVLIISGSQGSFDPSVTESIPFTLTVGSAASNKPDFGDTSATTALQVTGTGVSRVGASGRVGVPVSFAPTFTVRNGTAGTLNTDTRTARLLYTLTLPAGTAGSLVDAPVAGVATTSQTVNGKSDALTTLTSNATPTVGTLTYFIPATAGTYTVTVIHDANRNGVVDAFEASSQSTFVIAADATPAITFTQYGSVGEQVGANNEIGRLVKISLRNGTAAANLSANEVLTLTGTDVKFDNVSTVDAAGVQTMSPIDTATTLTLTASAFNGLGDAYINVYGTTYGTLTVNATVTGGTASGASGSFAFTVLRDSTATVAKTATAVPGTYSNENALLGVFANADLDLRIKRGVSTAVKVGFLPGAGAAGAGKSYYALITDTEGLITGLKGAKYTMVTSTSDTAANLLADTVASFSATIPATTLALPTGTDVATLTTLGADASTPVDAIVIKSENALPKYTYVNPAQTASTFTIRAGAATTNTFTVTSTDQFGNALPNITYTGVITGRNSSTVLPVYVTNASGQFTVSLTDTYTGGALSVTDSILLTATTGSSTATFTINYAAYLPVSKITMTTPDSANATATGIAGQIKTDISSLDGAEEGAVAVSAVLTDANGGTLPAGIPVTFSVAGTGVAILSTHVTVYTDSTGKATTSVYGWTNGDRVVTATAGTITASGTVYFRQSAAVSGVQAETRTISAKAAGNVVTATVTDRFGNPISGISVVATRVGTGTFNGTSSITGVTATDGTVDFVLTNGTADVTVAFTSPTFGASAATKGYADAGITALTAYTAGTVALAEEGVGASFDAAGVNSVKVLAVTDTATLDQATAATDAAAEATDAANAATDAANAAAEAADAATAAAQDAADAVAALSTQVSEMVSALKKQITALTNLVIKIQKKVRA